MDVPISGATQLTAVIGAPVKHSMSPSIHNAAFGAAGLDWRMVACEVAPGDGAAAVAAMRTLGLRGLAVTMPHKVDVARSVDEVDDVARALDSVNTVVLRDDGSTYGTSTDGDGLVASLLAAGHAVEGGRVAVVGAGAAARSIVDALGRSGAADISVINRTPSNAEAAAALAPVGRAGTLDDVVGADIIINTTPIGMADDRSIPIPVELLRDAHVVVDIVYHPLETSLLVAARHAGAATVDGLGMLVEQARLQQRLWTGQLPDTSVMRCAAERQLT